jgi:hypothetical protein
MISAAAQRTKKVIGPHNIRHQLLLLPRLSHEILISTSYTPLACVHITAASHSELNIIEPVYVLAYPGAFQYATSGMTGNNRENQDIPLRERLAATPAAIAARATPNPDQLSVRDGSSGQRGPGRNDKPDRLITSVALQRSIYIVFLTFLYGAAALYAWVIICILTDHPIGGTSYGLGELDHLLDHPQLGSGTVPEYLNELFAKSERYLRAARIVQSLVTVLTIPLTSAVCSQAAVVYLQRKRGTNRPTLRQSMALADKGWTDIKILSNLMLGGWKKYWSSLLILAALLHLLGEFIVFMIRLSFLLIIEYFP